VTASGSGELYIVGNKHLASLNGLDNINPGSINNLYIVSDSSLSDCAVQSVCNYLANPNGPIDIQGNATGCNSRQEVEYACTAIGVELPTQISRLTIYPNPASTQIAIETPDKGAITILNYNGNERLKWEITKPKTQLDISHLPNGVYFVRLTGDKTVQVGKFVKQ
jgi:hypothetical protein